MHVHHTPFFKPWRANVGLLILFNPSMENFMSNELKGKVNQAAGSVQKAYGKATDQPEHVIEGEGRKVKGKAQEAAGELGDKLK